MSRFEEVGVEHQQGAKCTSDAIRKYEKSCRICCDRGLRLDCDKCAIHHTHALVMAGLSMNPIRVQVLA